MKIFNKGEFLEIIMRSSVRDALAIVAILGLVSCLGDVIYEGARGITGQYLQILGASAAVVGFFAGLGEFFGYALRAIFGYISDKTKAYWLLTILGYTLLISIPLLAFAWSWEVAMLFVISERIGKAMRSPARDALISYSAKKIGTGFGFGIHEFLDQVGALIGPLFISIFFLNFKTVGLPQYRQAFSLLLIPFLALMLLLLTTYIIFKHVRVERRREIGREKFSSTFWLYIIFTSITTLGFMNFVILGYHFKVTHIIPEAQIPLLYSLAMAVDAVTALLIGKAYDKLEKGNGRSGLLLLFLLPPLTLAIPFLAFADSPIPIILGIVFFGMVIGSHETIMRAAIADIAPISKRGSAYGIFTAFYGFASLMGSALIGALYEISVLFLTIFILITQMIALAVLHLLRKKCI